MYKRQSFRQPPGETITAINAAAGVNKLLQISAGAAYTDNREVIEFDCTPRLKVLKEVIEETPRKVLVFTLFRHNMAVIENYLNKQGITCAQINGSVSATKRTAIFKKFQESVLTDKAVPNKATRNTLNDIRARDPNGIQVLIIQPQAAQHGVTLTAADTVVLWGPVMSVESYIQCIARTDRQGQTSDHVTVIHMEGSDIEKRMFKRLAGKVEDHSMLLKIYEEEIAG